MTTKLVLFDLDGTLLDTSEGIVESVRWAAERLGWPALSQSQLLSFIGPPLTVSFRRCYGCDAEQAAALTAAYREHYREGAMFRARPYDGIVSVCETLLQRGCATAVATSKPEVFAKQVLQKFDMDRLFTVIHGADMGGSLSKADVIRLCLEELGAAPSECLMVGDTQHDAAGAQELGVPFLGVTYGFGNLSEMHTAPHVALVNAPLEILDVVFGKGETEQHG